jgi:hypothetical protein
MAVFGRAPGLTLYPNLSWWPWSRLEFILSLPKDYKSSLRFVPQRCCGLSTTIAHANFCEILPNIV